VVKPLTLAELRADRQAVKLARRQAKQLESLGRRHTKERLDVLRQQCAAFDKQLLLHQRQRTHAERCAARNKFAHPNRLISPPTSTNSAPPPSAKYHYILGILSIYFLAASSSCKKLRLLQH